MTNSEPVVFSKEDIFSVPFKAVLGHTDGHKLKLI